MGSALAAVPEAPERLGLREFPPPSIGAADLLLRVEIAEVDGTDVNSFKGRLSEKLYASQYLRIMGDEVVGYVEEIGEIAAGRHRVTKADRIIVEPKIACHHCRFCDSGYVQFCREVRTYGVVLCAEPPRLWGRQAQYMYVAPGSRVHKISRGVSPEAAVLGAVVLSDGIRWIEKAGFGPDETVVILEPGPQGLASAIAANWRRAHHYGGESDRCVTAGVGARIRRG
jgi:threonine dehydrogenase-like Zn-dependent dehydrogenase